MSGDNMPNNDSSKDNGFIRQKIVRQKKSLKHRAKRGLTLCLAGILFGGAAAGAFVFLKPVFESHMAEPGETQPPITLPEDEIPVTTEAVVTTEAATTETEPLESVVQSLIEENKLGTNDYDSLFRSLASVAQEANKAVVPIHAVKQGTDWFDNTFNQSGTSPGLVLAKTPTEILLITRLESISGADSLLVTLGGDEMFPAQIKETDSVTGLGILGISTEDMPQEIIDGLPVLPLGNSHTVRLGDPLIAIGNPSGSMNSVVYGTVSYIRRNVQVMDGMMRVFETDCLTQPGGIVFMVNLSGELVGIKNNDLLEDSGNLFAAVMAVSDLKPLMEKMMNGQESAFLGVKGQDITEAMTEEAGIPRGIYVEEVQINSSAYNAGIQSGDVIVSIGGEATLTMKELQNRLAVLAPGEALSIVAMRGGREEYKEIGFDVTLDGR